jgi:hypothetical protein
MKKRFASILPPIRLPPAFHPHLRLDRLQPRQPPPRPIPAAAPAAAIASDGLWDKVSNQEAIKVVSRSRNAAVTSSVARSCTELVDMARRRDDIIVMVVDLERFVR